MDKTADAVLWTRLRAGNIDAWGLLFDRHAQRVYRFCSRFLGSQQDAEDVLSETFLEVWRARRSFTVQDESALPILLAIARRVGQKRLRSTRRLMRSDGLATTDLPPPVADVADQVLAKDETGLRRAWLRERVATLPAQFRDVFELVIYAEMTYEEVAHLLGVPLGTVKSRMARARHIIQTVAEEPGDSRQLVPAHSASERTWP